MLRPLPHRFLHTWLRVLIYAVVLLGAWWVYRLRSAEPENVALARKRVEPLLREFCEKAGLAYPPARLYLRAFKQEKELEVWGASENGPFKLLKTFPVLAASGKPGPKRKEGDRQVPEGCYRIVVLNPRSTYHLSLGLNYPNASDQVRSDKEHPGSDIYLHGMQASIGCLALGNPGIEELYILVADAGGREAGIPVHLFPARMAGEAWGKLQAAHPEQAAFWAELQPAFDHFERTREVPAVEVSSSGAYQLR